ncbi:hypothetical protein JST99_00335 [Candidatus Dependentiae bacterium]|nr:hypothetical protein [Candidatus Dependentiae bacterium]
MEFLCRKKLLVVLSLGMPLADAFSADSPNPTRGARKAAEAAERARYEAAYNDLKREIEWASGYTVHNRRKFLSELLYVRDEYLKQEDHLKRLFEESKENYMKFCPKETQELLNHFMGKNTSKIKKWENELKKWEECSFLPPEGSPKTEESLRKYFDRISGIRRYAAKGNGNIDDLSCRYFDNLPKIRYLQGQLHFKAQERAVIKKELIKGLPVGDLIDNIILPYHS